MKLQKLESFIRQLTACYGFDKVGFADAASPLQHAPYFEQWLGQGKHASMQWMATWADKRMDVTKLYSQAQSVVVVAQNYYHPAPHSAVPGNVKISRYAWGRDYHKIIKKKLKKILADIREQFPRADGRLFCDTAPVMEKQWAVAAGLGWQGKNTNLLTRDLGSWLFLGGILLNQPLPTGSPVQDFCGNCRACIDACPTAALEPYRLDASQCISYHTIENRDPEMDTCIAQNLNNWVFGCDICQDVCPWNSRAQQCVETAYHPPAENTAPDIRDLEKMDPTGFKTRFKKSPVYRAGYEGLQRNLRAVRRAGRPESRGFFEPDDR